MKADRKITQAAQALKLPERTVRAVLRRVGGAETLADVAEHSADAGWSGFTYYSDTLAFYRAHRTHINAMVFAMASELGEEPVKLVAGFNCLKWSEPDELAAIGRAIYAGRMQFDNDLDQLVANALAWFTLEEVARAYTDR